MSLDTALTTTEVVDRPHVPVNNEVIGVVILITNGVICQIINLFGMGTNIINIICFVKQGFKDAVNVSLLALAISDLGCLFTMIWTALCVIPMFREADLPFDSVDMQYLTTGIPHLIFTRITSCITALITLERCLCVRMPLKVANLLTPERATITIACIYVVLIVCCIPIYLANNYSMTFSSARNRTILTLISTDKRAVMELISFPINHILVPFAAFFIIIICMIILTVTLQKQARWRETCSSAVSTESTAEREQKVTKMIVMISVLFVACYTPSVLVFVAILLVPEFSYKGRYESVLVVTYSFISILESTNSSVNIFIYYHMSSRYRTAFRKTFAK